MEGADLRWTQMDGADLFEAQMEGADLSAAQMEGADLSGTDLRRSEWAGASNRAVAGPSADLRGAQGLTQGQLEELIGNADTLLPETVPPTAARPTTSGVAGTAAARPTSRRSMPAAVPNR